MGEDVKCKAVAGSIVTRTELQHTEVHEVVVCIYLSHQYIRPWHSRCFQGLDVRWGLEDQQAHIERLSIDEAEAALGELHGSLLALGFQAKDVESALEVTMHL